MKKCLLDMDGVIVNFVRGAIELHHLSNNIYDNPEALGNFDLVALSGLSAKDFWKPMGFDFWNNLHWTYDGQNILNLVISKFGKEHICLLTAPCFTEGCMEGKFSWIKRHLPDFTRNYLMGPRKEFCAKENHYLIDDRDQNIADFNQHGGNGILVPRPWNKEYKHRNHTLEILKKKLDQI